jgi:hypothetical protein
METIVIPLPIMFRRVPQEFHDRVNASKTKSC